MFDDYSFPTASRHPSSLGPPRKLALRTYGAPHFLESPLMSPTSTALLDPVSRLASMDELSRQLSQHSLHGHKAQSSVDHSAASRRSSCTTGLLTPPNEPVASPSYLLPTWVLDDDLAYAIQPSDSSVFPRGSSLVALRKSRQRAVRMQCSTAHLNDIAMMVRRRDQCTVDYTAHSIPTSDAKLKAVPPAPRTPSISTLDENEQMDECDSDNLEPSSGSDAEASVSLISLSKSLNLLSREWRAPTARGCITKSRRTRYTTRGRSR